MRWWSVQGVEQGGTDGDVISPRRGFASGRRSSTADTRGHDTRGHGGVGQGDLGVGSAAPPGSRKTGSSSSSFWYHICGVTSVLLPGLRTHFQLGTSVSGEGWTKPSACPQAGRGPSSCLQPCVGAVFLSLEGPGRTWPLLRPCPQPGPAGQGTVSSLSPPRPPPERTRSSKVAPS